MSIPPPGPHKRYLGDGAYADLADGQLILTTEDGYRTTNVVVLDDVVLQALLKYLEANTKLRFSIAEG